MLFEELEKEEPEHFAVRQYKKYKLAAGKTAKSILISCGARLAPFDIAELREIMSYDEMELDMVGDQRTALFIIISDTDDTFNFVVAMMYSQLFNLLCDRADDVHHGRLPYHVRILCDEFANIGQIPKFDKLIATIRSREISASIILQSQSQLKTIYKDAAETILGNCDTMLFLGGKESSTLKEISETLGKETIDLYNTSDTRGQSRSYGMNYQKTGKVCGIELPEGLKESDKLPEPIYTPSTKAEIGDHDENISYEQSIAHLEKYFPGKGAEYAEKLRDYTIALYKKCADYALSKGIIIADTKFEFGLDENGNIVIGDEMLTPDSSRFWPADGYEPGHGQPSFDKQFARDWLKANDGNHDWTLPQEIVDKTIEKYLQAYEMLTGKPLA
jgi:hypothetical protein